MALLSFAESHDNHSTVDVYTAVREHVLKRFVDIALSIFMMMLAVPVFLPVALAIKLEDGGPVFYRQERWGLKGRKFRAYKFRTMVPDSDEKYGVIQAREDDDRITKTGRILRAMGLDELPQIFNILLGQMSFVGPRSLAVGEIVRDENGQVVEYETIPGFRERLLVRPGLTGLATIYIRKDAAPRRKFRYDLFYVRNQSLLLDLKLIALSFWISFRGKWETRGEKV
ncbi:MAG: sugar transferase [Deltaproteobacteria bacterium]|nr:sugar transferase [Deltaproteobacteria bacterium]MBW2072291.1 sugar transferase [Deltaproteobacteria bacterium]